MKLEKRTKYQALVFSTTFPLKRMVYIPGGRTTLDLDAISDMMTSLFNSKGLPV